MRLSSFIAQNREKILQNWEDFARFTETPNGTKDIVALRDHASVMLDTSIVDLDI